MNHDQTQPGGAGQFDSGDQSPGETKFSRDIELRPPGDFPTPEPLDFLVVAPHPDDAEVGMGGTIAKMSAAGMRVGILDLTTGEPTPQGSETLRRQETIAATESLKIAWRGNAGMRNRFLENSLENRATLAGYFRILRPRWLFTPYWEDAHPDHVAATSLTEAARFWSKLSKCDLPGQRYHPERIYYYYCMHLRLAIKPDVIVDISDHWESRSASLRAYHSQFVAGRTESPPLLDRLETEAAHWGFLINRRFGEPFATKEPLAVDSIANFI